MKENQQNIKENVLDTALALFTEKGYFNTSVHDIRRAADVSIGAIYHHFENKEGIAKALYDSVVDRMTTTILEIEERYATAHDRCRAIVGCFFAMADDHPEIMKYILYARHREFMPDEQPICSSRPFEMMKEMVEAGIVNGEIRAVTPIVAATSVFGGAIRMVHLLLDGVIEGPMANHLDEVWSCAWSSVAV